MGIKENDTIIIAAVTIPEVIYAFYALNQLGAISNMVDPRTSERGIQKYILESKARYILTLDILAEKIQGAIRDTSIEKMITKRVVYTDANGVKWIRSGDIGHMDEQGFLYIDGRIKRIIIRHDGFKVFPTQIENVIATCPEVKTCCAIGRADKDHSQGKLPVVYITLSREKKDKMKLKEELNSLCKQMLPEYMQPIDFVFIDKMPLTANGKVDFHELEGIELSNRL